MLNFLLACIHLDPVSMSMTGGYIGLALLIFAESGLLIGIFLPGDSLLFAAGLLAAAGYMAYPPLVVVVTIAAMLGDSVGYWFGANVGTGFFKRKNSRIFKREYLTRTEQFYTAHGPRTVLLARFLPIVRTLAPILAGIARMRYTQFVTYNAVGALVWGAGMVSVGYFLGSVVPGASGYLLPLSLLVVVLSFLPVVARGAFAAFTGGARKRSRSTKGIVG